MPDDVLTCTVSVVDSDGASASDSLTRSISNRAPTLTGTAISPATAVTTSTELTCTVQAPGQNRPENDPKMKKWKHIQY